MYTELNNFFSYHLMIYIGIQHKSVIQSQVINQKDLKIFRYESLLKSYKKEI